MWVPALAFASAVAFGLYWTLTGGARSRALAGDRDARFITRALLKIATGAAFWWFIWHPLPSWPREMLDWIVYLRTLPAGAVGIMAVTTWLVVTGLVRFLLVALPAAASAEKIIGRTPAATQRASDAGACTARINATDTFYLGRCWNSENGRIGRRVAFDLAKIAHMTLIGPTSCGKGATVELPNLLGDGMRHCNVISLDPTGQNFEVSWRWRSSFSDVLPLNPFKLHDGDDVGCNPLLSVETFEDAMAVAEAMMEVKPDAREPFFVESAQGLIAGVVLAVVRDCKTRKLTPTLMKVRKILTDNLEGFAAMMAGSGDFQLASLLGRFQKENRTIDLIKQTADNASKWLLSAEIQKSLGVAEGEGIDWTQLKHGRRPFSVFVILDADKLLTFAPWLRLVLVSALNTLYRLGGGGRKTVFMLSEMAALGRLQPVIAGLGQGRKYNIRFAPMVIQNPSQLSAIYGRDDAGTVIGNSGCLLGFAPAPVDNESAEFLSRAAGTHWVPDIRAEQ